MASNWPWSVLGLDGFSDHDQIRKSYARILREIDRNDPVEFGRLREAYEAALSIYNSQSDDNHAEVRLSLVQDEPEAGPSLDNLDAKGEQLESVKEDKYNQILLMRMKRYLSKDSLDFEQINEILEKRRKGINFTNDEFEQLIFDYLVDHLEDPKISWTHFYQLVDLHFDWLHDGVSFTNKFGDFYSDLVLVKLTETQDELGTKWDDLSRMVAIWFGFALFRFGLWQLGIEKSIIRNIAYVGWAYMLVLAFNFLFYRESFEFKIYAKSLVIAYVLVFVMVVAVNFKQSKLYDWYLSSQNSSVFQESIQLRDSTLRAQSDVVRQHFSPVPCFDFNNHASFSALLNKDARKPLPQKPYVGNWSYGVSTGDKSTYRVAYIELVLKDDGTWQRASASCQRLMVDGENRAFEISRSFESGEWYLESIPGSEFPYLILNLDEIKRVGHPQAHVVELGAEKIIYKVDKYTDNTLTISLIKNAVGRIVSEKYVHYASRFEEPIIDVTGFDSIENEIKKEMP